MAEPSIVWNQEGEERIPRSFGRLWLLRRLARGGMGEVYLASTTGIEGAERPCVVKIIRRDHAADKSFLARFLDEARVQAQLQHHGVAQILEASTDQAGEPYVVVEHVEGRSLGEVRTRAIQAGVSIDWSDAVAIGVSAAEALGHVHERTDSSGHPLGIVHRDLSPQNVMLGYGGDLKLIDFGTARGENRRCHTISGVVFAKPGYVAPEVANGISGDFKVDLYALGIMLWELLAGRRFLHGDAAEHMALVAKDERKPPRVAALVGAPLALDEIIAQLVAHRVEDRYASAKLAASDLVKLLSKAPGLPNGERGVRARVAHLMQRLYPSEPARSRAEFASLVKAARWAIGDEAKVVEPPSSEPKAEGDVLPGTRYRLVKTIGSGAMGVVYEAVHLDLLRRVALKVMSSENAASLELAAGFRREAQAVARLAHPNLVMMHDFGETSDGRPYCAMELLEGETLQARLEREERLDVRDALALGIMVCRGLEAAHAAGVIHRDLKPANLFLSQNRSAPIKILDFGLANTGQEPVQAEDGEVAIMGTPEYMAPEQARPGEIDARADLYALGCVLYEMCTGQLPFAASSPVAIAELKSRSWPEPMRTRASALRLPESLDRVLMKVLSPLPADRYSSARELRRELEQVQRAPVRRRATSRWLSYAMIAATSLFGLVAIGATRTLPTAGSPSPLMSEDAAEPVLAAVPGAATATVTPAPPVTTIPKAVVNAIPSSGAQRHKSGRVNDKLAAAAQPSHDVASARARAESAAAARDWNEAAQAAEVWALVDSSVEPRLYLARMLVYAGRNRAAVRILENLLEAHPECDEARALLSDFRGGEVPTPASSARAERAETVESPAVP
jgi:serine/threonine-protein kinase